MAQLWFIGGLVLGGVAVWLAMRGRTAQLRETFQALSAEALKSNNESFLSLAKTHLGQHQSEAKLELEQRQQAVAQLVAPLGESLKRVDAKLEQLERTRRETHGTLTEHLRSVTETQQQLRSETQNLVTALRSPVTRGRWGEIQLKRVCELAGMLPYCDFTEQTTVRSEDGLLRPDLIVKLPGDKQVVVDAKAPLQAYLDALATEDHDERAVHMQTYARHIREHMRKLSEKSYWSQFPSAPEFVVMFMPSEALFSAALEHAPSLIEEGVNQSVILATPTTLIALLRAVAYGWRQERVAESARAVSELGSELYSRLGVLANHFTKLGRQLDGSVRTYNEAVGSLESRVLVSARKLTEHGAAASDSELPAPEPIDTQTRQIQAPELTEPDQEISVRKLSQRVESKN